MAVFKFRLQKVLELRTQLEDQAKMAFGHAKHLFAQKEHYIEVLTQKIVKEKNKPFVITDHTAGDAWLAENYLKGLETDRKYAKKELIYLGQEVERTRQALVLAAQEKKLVEKLREKQEIRFRKEELYAEQKNNDEIATLRPKASPFASA